MADRSNDLLLALNNFIPKIEYNLHHLMPPNRLRKLSDVFFSMHVATSVLAAGIIAANIFSSDKFLIGGCLGCAMALISTNFINYDKITNKIHPLTVIKVTIALYTIAISTSIIKRYL